MRLCPLIIPTHTMMPMTAPANRLAPSLRTADAMRPGLLRVRRCLLAVLSWLMVAGPLPCHAQGDPDDAGRTADTARVVAGIISYVRWPQPQPQLQLCLVGLTRYAQQLTEERLSTPGQRITPRLVTDLTAAALEGCRLVYIGKLSEADYRKLLPQVVDHPVLSFTEADVSCDTGSMFCLKSRDKQIAFDANLDAIARSGLRVHPSVLQLARRKPSP